MDESVVNVYVFIVAMGLEGVSLFLSGLVVQRNVHLRAFGFASPTIIIIPILSTRVKTTVIISMNGYEKHVRILIEDMMSAISSVDIIIKDSYLFE